MPFPKELAAPVYAKGTAPVGTPVKVFAPYSAPNFTTPAALIGQVIAPVTLQSTAAMDQANVPFTFGHAFKRGDLGPDCSLVGAIAGKADLQLQVNVKATHDDGSVRHAIISGVLPSLPASASVAMGLKRSTLATPSANVPLPANLPSASLTIAGVAYTAAPKAGDFIYAWLSCSLLTDYVANVPFVDAGGNAHPTLTAQFSVRAYSSGAVRVDAVIEHCKAYASTTDITYDVTIAANGATVYSQAGLVHSPCARWKKQFWYGTAPSLHIKHDTAYLIATRQVPNYDQTITVSEAALQSYATDLASGVFGPMQFGRFQPYMGTTGGRPDIGLMPDSYAATLLSMDKRAKDAMLASADIAGSWTAHRRDDSNGPGKGLPLSVINFPYASILGTTGDCNNPATGKNEHFPALTTASKSAADTSHQAAFAYLPYLLTGDYYYLEEMHFWQSFNGSADNCWYRKLEKSLVCADQVRGQGWTLRTLAECAAITPDDHPAKQSFIFWYESNMAWFNTTYIDAPDPKYSNKLGIVTNGYALGYPINGQAETGMAPWMDDHFTSALGHGVELLGFESTKRLLQWKSKFQIGRMVAPGVCWTDASIYSLGVRPSSTSPFFDTLADCYKFTLPAAQYSAVCNSPERLAQMNLDGSSYKLGEMLGYPGASAGFPANFQPALAVTVDTGNPDGLKAWQLFNARSTKPDYWNSPQFAVVPRILTESATAPAPAPAPDPAPTPTPDTPSAPAPSGSAKIVAEPTVAGTWAKVGDEYGTVTVPTNTTVRYGYDGRYVYAIVSGTFIAANSFFGSDPAVGVAKVVDAFTVAVVSSDPVPSPAPAPASVIGAIKTPSNTKLAGKTGLSMAVFNPSTLALVKKFTGLTASSKGVLTVKDTALVPGTVYAAVVADSAGRVLDVMYPLTAA